MNQLIQPPPLDMKDPAFRARHGLDQIFASAQIMPRTGSGDVFLDLALHSMGVEPGADARAKMTSNITPTILGHA